MTQNFEQIAGADILIVDDTPDNIRFLSSLLTKKGYKVRKALNGQMALIAAKTLTPDLILLDVNMPEMDGYEVCRRLKQDKAAGTIPVIFLSAWDAAEDKVKAFQAGGSDYITKPFQFEEVLIRIENQLTIRHLQKQLQSQNSELKQVIETLSQSQVALVQQETIAQLSRLAIGTLNGITPPLSQISIDLNTLQHILPALVQSLQPAQREAAAGLTDQAAANAVSSRSVLPDLVQVVDSMQAETVQMQATLSALQQFVDLPLPEVGSIDIHQAIDRMLLLLQPGVTRPEPQREQQCTIELVKDYGALPLVTCSVRLFHQAIFNLLNRAIEALSAKSSQMQTASFQPVLSIKTETSDRETVLIHIQDNGVQENSADPPAAWADRSNEFASASQMNEAIGVAVCQQIVEATHQGHLTYQSLAEGSEFIVEMPVHFQAEIEIRRHED